MNKQVDEKNVAILINKGKISKITDMERDDHYVVGSQASERIYLVVPPGFCTCDQFIFRCIKVPGRKCKHILAVEKCDSPASITDVNICAILSRSG